jgi:16S rRNA (cytosine967-C5)-methyltransferase
MGARRSDPRPTQGLPDSFAAAFDAVLLDAPCSGFGTLGSRADLRWRRSPHDVPRLAELQRRLLARAAALVKPGGALTYAVCTVTRAETAWWSRSRRGRWAPTTLARSPGGAPGGGGYLLTLPPGAARGSSSPVCAAQVA